MSERKREEATSKRQRTLAGDLLARVQNVIDSQTVKERDNVYDEDTWLSILHGEHELVGALNKLEHWKKHRPMAFYVNAIERWTKGREQGYKAGVMKYCCLLPGSAPEVLLREGMPQGIAVTGEGIVAEMNGQKKLKASLNVGYRGLHGTVENFMLCNFTAVEEDAGLDDVVMLDWTSMEKTLKDEFPMLYQDRDVCAWLQVAADEDMTVQVQAAPMPALLRKHAKELLLKNKEWLETILERFHGSFENTFTDGVSPNATIEDIIVNKRYPVFWQEAPYSTLF